MKTRNILVLLPGLLFFAFTAMAAPRIECVPTGIDLGNLDDSSTVERVVHVWNRGDQPLYIKRIVACCGASVTLASKSVAPGSNTVMRLHLDLSGRSKAFRKTVRLVSNDPDVPVYGVLVTGGTGPSDSVVVPELLSAAYYDVKGQP